MLKSRTLDRLRRLRVNVLRTNGSGQSAFRPTQPGAICTRYLTESVITRSRQKDLMPEIIGCRPQGRARRERALRRIPFRGLSKAGPRSSMCSDQSVYRARREILAIVLVANSPAEIACRGTRETADRRNPPRQQSRPCATLGSRDPARVLRSTEHNRAVAGRPVEAHGFEAPDAMQNLKI